MGAPDCSFKLTRVRSARQNIKFLSTFDISQIDQLRGKHKAVGESTVILLTLSLHRY